MYRSSVQMSSCMQYTDNINKTSGVCSPSLLILFVLVPNGISHLYHYFYCLQYITFHMPRIFLILFSIWVIMDIFLPILVEHVMSFLYLIRFIFKAYNIAYASTMPLQGKKNITMKRITVL